ncbi:MAG: cupin domain-containing protein [Deltaproteobacteria bacterium]|nr:cupin domain-containing protein [Deltaproteobacteria bacterium]
MFCRKNAEGYYSRIKGIDQKTLVFGERTLLAEFRLKEGSVIPPHSHPNEQTGYLVSGHMVFTAGDEQFDARPGDSWCIAAGVEHSADVITDSVAVEAFSPVREDYLPNKKFVA